MARGREAFARLQPSPNDLAPHSWSRLRECKCREIALSCFFFSALLSFFLGLVIAARSLPSFLVRPSLASPSIPRPKPPPPSGIIVLGWRAQQWGLFFFCRPSLSSSLHSYSIRRFSISPFPYSHMDTTNFHDVELLSVAEMSFYPFAKSNIQLRNHETNFPWC